MSELDKNNNVRVAQLRFGRKLSPSFAMISKSDMLV